ncbi:MAG: hypothetical protein HY854_05930 [Burkholderiales bacterium]|nr:hypothetical protein [Burkholderiales bacterium]
MGKLINAALLFEELPTRAFIAYAQELATSNACDVTLGPNNRPHSTIVQFEVGEGENLRDWAAVAQELEDPIPLSLVGLTVVPSKEGHLWVEIAILKSEALIRCQNGLLEKIGRRAVHNGVRDAFRPHITLTRILNSRRINDLTIDDTVVRMKNISGRLTLGLAGPNYEYIGPI